MGADEEGTHERLKAHRRNWSIRRSRSTRAHRQDHRRRHAGGISQRRRRDALGRRGAARDDRPRARGARRAANQVSHRRQSRDIIAEGGDIFGDGVNVAARLEALAEPGGICISRTVRDQIRDKLTYQFEIWASKALKTSRDRSGSMRCIPKPSPICRRRPCACHVNLAAGRCASMSIVVLPFTNLSNDPEQQYFADASRGSDDRSVADRR